MSKIDEMESDISKYRVSTYRYGILLASRPDGGQWSAARVRDEDFEAVVAEMRKVMERHRRNNRMARRREELEPTYKQWAECLSWLEAEKGFAVGDHSFVARLDKGDGSAPDSVVLGINADRCRINLHAGKVCAPEASISVVVRSPEDFKETYLAARKAVNGALDALAKKGYE